MLNYDRCTLLSSFQLAGTLKYSTGFQEAEKTLLLFHWFDKLYSTIAIMMDPLRSNIE